MLRIHKIKKVLIFGTLLLSATCTPHIPLYVPPLAIGASLTGLGIFGCYKKIKVIARTSNEIKKLQAEIMLKATDTKNLRRQIKTRKRTRKTAIAPLIFSLISIAIGAKALHVGFRSVHKLANLALKLRSINKILLQTRADEILHILYPQQALQNGIMPTQEAINQAQQYALLEFLTGVPFEYTQGVVSHADGSIILGNRRSQTPACQGCEQGCGRCHAPFDIIGAQNGIAIHRTQNNVDVIDNRVGVLGETPDELTTVELLSWAGHNDPEWQGRWDNRITEECFSLPSHCHRYRYLRESLTDHARREQLKKREKAARGLSLAQRKLFER